MAAPGYALFDTAIGACALAWGAAGIVRVLLPERDADDLRARLARQHPAAAESAPPSPIAQAIARIQALAAGAPDDLRDVALDLSSVPALDGRIYAAVRAVTPGRTRTYGEIAADIGAAKVPGSARAVGQAMARNPFPIVVPCHRILAAHGAAGGFSARGGVGVKLRLLTIEAAHAPKDALFDALPYAAKPAE